MKVMPAVSFPRLLFICLVVSFALDSGACTAAQLAALKASPGGTITGIAATCAGPALKTAGDITQTVDAGGANWFQDFSVALDGLLDFACVEQQLQVPPGFAAPPGAQLAPPAPTYEDRRAIALVEIHHRRLRNSMRLSSATPARK